MEKIDEHINDKELSWRIPPGYKVIKAELKDSKGKLICSHEKTPCICGLILPAFQAL